MRRKPRPEIDPVYDQDSTDDELQNTVGKIPMVEWIGNGSIGMLISHTLAMTR